MKKTKKFALKKVTIAALNNLDLQNINGGGETCQCDEDSGGYSCDNIECYVLRSYDPTCM